MTEALEKIGLRRMSFAFDHYGAQVMHTGEALWVTAPSLRTSYRVAHVMQ